MKKYYVQPASVAVELTPATMLAGSGGNPPSPSMSGSTSSGSGASLIWGGSTSDEGNKGINWNPD